jgi:translation initiation factor 3 subunit H
MDVDGELQITNSFPFPTVDTPAQDDKHDKENASSGNVAPRSKVNAYYQQEMVRCLRDMNVDASSAGWYQSASLGNFVCSQLHGTSNYRCSD